MKPHQLREARNKLGISQTQMAAYMGIASDRSIRRWERDGAEVPAWAALIVRYWLRDLDEARNPRKPIRR